MVIMMMLSVVRFPGLGQSVSCSLSDTCACLILNSEASMISSCCLIYCPKTSHLIFLIEFCTLTSIFRCNSRLLRLQSRKCKVLPLFSCICHGFKFTLNDFTFKSRQMRSWFRHWNLTFSSERYLLMFTMKAK